MTHNVILHEKLALIQEQLGKSTDVVYHCFTTWSGQPCALVYIEGIVSREGVQRYVLEPLIRSHERKQSFHDLLENVFLKKHLAVAGYRICHDIGNALQELLDGSVLLLMDQEVTMASFPLGKYEMRQVNESTNENVIRGPKEAFVEDLKTNISLLRRKIKSEKLTVDMLRFGELTHTKASILYLNGVCEEQLVHEVKERLGKIELDGVLDSGYLEAFLEDEPMSPFPQLENTERPDVAAASLLEGRIAILLDGSPVCLIAPVTFFMLMQAAEDYYQRAMVGTWVRWVRFFSILISLTLPSLYVAITTFHAEVLPTNLMLTIAAARDIVPFPALLEALMMELTFEVLREASVRIPKPLGQAISILGALVIGTAAVQAGIVSAPMVIVVSLTGITSYVVPHNNLGTSIRLLRFPVLIMASVFGVFGIMICFVLIILHLCTLRSLGTPYLTPLNWSEWKDVFVRVPWTMMKNRPSLFGTAHNKARTEDLTGTHKLKEEKP
ncbi:spore germination protein [Bacillus sp. A301a_S52]|nr:spore germination protein [Bacillus sp. A301a_S52]